MFFEKTVTLCKKPKRVSNWILRDILGYLNEHKLELFECKIKPETLSELILEVDKQIITSKTAQEVFLEMAATGKYPSIIIQEKGLKQISSPKDIQPIVEKVISENKEQVESFKAGNERLFTYFIGQVMKEMKGKGSPKIIKEILENLLK